MKLSGVKVIDVETELFGLYFTNHVENSLFKCDDGVMEAPFAVTEIVRVQIPFVTPKQINCDRSYELRFAKILDLINVKWIRNTERFRYFDDASSKFRNYTPDFFLAEYNCYIETKGYETDLDRCKWRDFTGRLIVIKGKDLDKLESEPNGIWDCLLSSSFGDEPDSGRDRRSLPI